ncbi:MAG: hypothetical protein ACWGQW_24395, partial [bacterium]
MRLTCILCFVVGGWVSGSPVLALALPGDYFNLMASELERIEAAPEPSSSPSVMLAAAVLYTRQHPNNRFFGDKKMLAMALQVGDLVA